MAPPRIFLSGTQVSDTGPQIYQNNSPKTLWKFKTEVDPNPEMLVRPCVRASVCPLTFSNNFSEAAEPILLKFHMVPP